MRVVRLPLLRRRQSEPAFPVINIDREFSTTTACQTWIGDDNYGIGKSGISPEFASRLLQKGPNSWTIWPAVMRNQRVTLEEASVGSRPVDTSRWATSPILLCVSRAARRSRLKAVTESTSSRAIR
jgi:hypothetical protein